MKTPADIAIVGAGMIGATAALALADAGFDCVLLAAQPVAPLTRDALTDRFVLALNARSLALLDAVRVRAAIAPVDLHPFEAMCVWDGVRGGRLRFDAAELGVSALGWIAFQQAALDALHARIATHDRIRIEAPQRVTGLEVHADHAVLRCASGLSISARLVIGADGQDSAVRALAGIGTTGHAYRQSAIVANVTHAIAHADTAWQVFLPEGPLAFLPLADGRSSIVWTTSEARARDLMALDDAAFLAELHRASDDVLGAFGATGPRAATPLVMAHAREYVAPRIVLVGDAAHRAHPLAGQGANVGCADLVSLIDVLSRAQARGEDVGHPLVLARHARARRGEVTVMLAAFDGLNRLFSNASPTLAAARSWGLSQVDGAGGLKRWFARQAM